MPLPQHLRTALFIVTSLLFGAAKAQYITIPDANFAAELANIVPGCISGNQLDTTCSQLKNIDYVDMGNKNIADVSGVEYLRNLIGLDLSNNPIVSLPSFPKNIRSLSLDYTQLSGDLPFLPSSLQSLSINYTDITSLPGLPPGLQLLACSYTRLNTLPPLPATLISLDISKIGYVSIPVALPATLRDLDCSDNAITALPNPLPQGLKSLLCKHNELTSLPALPGGLQSLDCSGNHLTTLPALPATLTSLACLSNNLTILPGLPVGLEGLDCSYNKISSLQPFTSKLTSIACSHNLLSMVPGFPARNYYTIDVSYNQLTELPELPDTITQLYCNNNPKLACLPQLKKIGSFQFGGTAISCVPNYISGVYSEPKLSSLPLCDIFSSSGCGFYWGVSGKVYSDADNNCKYNGTDTLQNNIKVQLWNNGQLKQEVFTNKGAYSFKTHTANYELRLDTTGIPFTVTCPVSGIYRDTMTATDSVHFNRDFSLTCKPGFDVGAISIEGRFRPGSYRQVNINAGDMATFYNTHCTTGVGGAVIATITGPAHFSVEALGALQPSSINDQAITWNLADFSILDMGKAFNVITVTDNSAQLGQQVCITVAVTASVTGDMNLYNDTLIQCFTVVGSFDPNDKSVSPIGNTAPDTRWLTYTVRFQNTGTDTAQHIYILDTLDANLDASTFQLLDYSHKPMLAQILEGGIARFNFPNITLPDSNVNEPLSHGYVLYRIAPKRNLPLGTQIRNTAYIYFDFNEPVVTNSTLNTLTKEVATAVSPLSFGEGQGVSLYPNPTTSTLTIQTTGFAPMLTSIYNTQGQKVHEEKYHAQMDVSALPPGIYFIEVNGEQQVVRKKFVKE